MDFKDIVSNLDELDKEIDRLQLKIKNKDVDIRMDIVYFCIIFIGLSIFISVIFYDLLSTFKIYFDKNKLINSKKVIKNDDDYDYEDSVYNNINTIEQVKKQVVTKKRAQKRNLQPYIDWKKSNNIKNYDKIESLITLNSLDKKFDNYEYNEKKNGESFWKLLFMPPKYHELINNEAVPYFKMNEVEEDEEQG